MENNEFVVQVDSTSSDSASPAHPTANATPPPPAMPAPAAGNPSVDGAAPVVTPGSGVGESGQETAGGSASGVGLFGRRRRRGRPRRNNADESLRMPRPSRPGYSGNMGWARPLGFGSPFLSQSSDWLSNTACWDFTTHMIMVNAGEDVARKIVAIVRRSQRGVCVLCATGAISKIAIHGPGSPGGSMEFEGRFEIVSLSGSFTVANASTSRGVMGGLSVSLACADGRIIGGGLAGPLVAATPIQMIIGTFVPNNFMGHNIMNRREYASTSASPGIGPHSTTGAVPNTSPPGFEGHMYSTPMQAGRQFNDVAGDNDIRRNASAGGAGINNPENVPAQRTSPEMNMFGAP
ncbi:AT-hook motif nuclear-localized protein 2-like [Punica granatum]|uniref:AT-hook motif nuclear-localized protein n=1 Tax=Punica granatum TaxID=22663 RepID=A0A6P8DKN4_PUNGR|nr:AT-hook motif nuclear-localized protein 2-like [Punica granatum]